MHSTKQPQVSKRFEAHQYEKLISDLLEKIDVLESKLKLMGKEKIRLVTSFKELDKEIIYLKSELDKAEKEKSQVNENTSGYLEQLKTLKEQYQSTQDTYRTKFDLISRELQQKEAENERLSQTIKEKDEKIQTISINNTMALRFSDTYADEIEHQQVIIKSQKKKSDELEKEINELYLSKKSEGNLMLENEHLKEDNIRLLEMLKSTKEYQDFGYLSQTTPGGIRYVNEPLVQKKSHHECKIRESERLNKKKNDNWISSEAFNTVLEYNQRFNLEMNDQVISDMLASLNKIWKEKENKQITRVKAKYQREICELKRKYGVKNYTLSDVSGHKSVPTSSTKKGKEDEYSKKLLENVKTITTTFSKEKQSLETQITTLQHQLKSKKQPVKSKEIDIVHENSLIIDKALKEFNQFELLISDLFEQYEERVKDTETMLGTGTNPLFNIKMINNSVNWFFTSVKDVLGNTRKRFELWKSEYNSLQK